MKKFNLKKFNYSLFDETGGGGAGASAQMSEGAAKQSGGENNGIQPNEPVAGADVSETQNPNPKPKDLRAKYDEFMKDEKMKAFANEDMQRVINRRFRENKNLQEQLQKQSAVMERLSQKFGVDDPDELCAKIDSDNTFWETAAMEAGMNVEQFKEYSKYKREAAQNRRIVEAMQKQQQVREQYAGWLKEAEELRGIYPDFDLEKELQNDDFKRILGQPNAQYAISMKQAYEIIHHEDIINGIRQKAEQETQKRVVDNIKSRGARPVEGAVSQQSGVTYKTDVTKLTKKDREEIAQRVMRGEIISFS